MFSVCSLSWSQALPTPEQSNQQIDPLPQQPVQAFQPIDKSLPIEEQRRLMLGQWTEFWERLVKPYLSTTLPDWYKQATDSWTKLKASYEKQLADQLVADAAKDRVVQAQASEIAVLKSQLAQAHRNELTNAIWGFLGGIVSDEVAHGTGLIK
jgi:uncharacterized protein YeaO (DUF488 family)